MTTPSITDLIVDLDQAVRNIEIAATRAMKLAQDNGLHGIQQPLSDHARVACYELESMGRLVESIESDDTRNRLVIPEAS